MPLAARSCPGAGPAGEGALDGEDGRLGACEDVGAGVGDDVGAGAGLSQAPTTLSVNSKPARREHVAPRTFEDGGVNIGRPRSVPGSEVGRTVYRDAELQSSPDDRDVLNSSTQRTPEVPMNSTPSAQIRTFMSRDPLEFEADTPSALQTHGPELTLILTAISAVGLVTGAMSLDAAGALLAMCTGLVVAISATAEVSSLKPDRPLG
ncbi:MAG: hypothetical protein CMJ34_13940 [Phycisphaerae bacterium]|nr:hypothetical protein [Phycisphaerae bacterium]